MPISGSVGEMKLDTHHTILVQTATQYIVVQHTPHDYTDEECDLAQRHAVRIKTIILLVVDAQIYNDNNHDMLAPSDCLELQVNYTTVLTRNMSRVPTCTSCCSTNCQNIAPPDSFQISMGTVIAKKCTPWEVETKESLSQLAHQMKKEIC